VIYVKRSVNRGYKVRIYPTSDQINLIEKTFGCVRLMWNYSLMERKEVYNLYKDYPELYKSHKYKLKQLGKVIFHF